MQQYNTRIKLKSDTQENWNKLAPTNNNEGFKPLNGEIIIYSADNDHPYARLKVGDGNTNVVELPFIDAGTLSGKETELVKAEAYRYFPSPGSEDKLYVDLSTNKIYHYSALSGYAELAHFSFSIQKATFGSVTSWKPGRTTSASITDNTLEIDIGSLPELSWEKRQVVTNVTEEE